MEKKIDWDKPVQTRKGLSVKIYSRTGGGQSPIHGAYLVQDANGSRWQVSAWTENGRVWNDDYTSDFDLVNVETPISVEGRVSLYRTINNNLALGILQLCPTPRVIGNSTQRLGDLKFCLTYHNKSVTLRVLDFSPIE